VAARIGVTTDIETHPLADANVALRRLEAGEVRGTAVLVVDPAITGQPGPPEAASRPRVRAAGP